MMRFYSERRAHNNLLQVHSLLLDFFPIFSLTLLILILNYYTNISQKTGRNRADVGSDKKISGVRELNMITMKCTRRKTALVKKKILFSSTTPYIYHLRKLKVIVIMTLLKIWVK